MNARGIGEKNLSFDEMPDLSEIARRSEFLKQAKDYFPEILKTICDATKASACCLKWLDHSLDALTPENAKSLGEFCRNLDFSDWDTGVKQKPAVAAIDVRTDSTFPDAVREKFLKSGILTLKRIPIVTNNHTAGVLLLAFSKADSNNDQSGILDSQIRLIQKMSENFQLSTSSMTTELIRLFEQQTIDGMLITSEDFRVIYANRLLEKLFNKKATRFLGLPLKDANSVYGEVLQNELKALKRHSSGTKQVKLISKRGKEIFLQIKGTQLKASGDQNYFLWILNDVTKKIQKQKSLEKWRKNMEEFTYTVSHDLKAPIISIEGYISLLMAENNDELSGDGKYYIEKVMKNVQMMKNMIQDLLELSRIQQDKDEFRLTSLGPILRNALDEFRFQIEKGQIDLVLPNRSPRLKCNPGLIQILFSNLISNAIKFMGDQQHPRIEIGWKRKETLLTLFFKDNGIGISPKNSDRIFDVFYRLQRPGEVEGSGVGLAIVKKIVDVHGGTIEVESDVGKGAAFIVSFPIQH